MFKKYGKFIFIAVLLLLATEITIYMKGNADSKSAVGDETELKYNQEGNTVDMLRDQLENSTALTDGMNPYRDYWFYEIGYFSENYPTEHEELFESIDIKQWNNDFEALNTLVSTEYIDDKSLMKKVNDTIDKYIKNNYIDDIFTQTMEDEYFYNVILLMKEDHTLE